MSDLFEQPDDATPLTPEEVRELIPAHIAYRRELNEAEQENIARAQDWALNRRRDPLAERGGRWTDRYGRSHPARTRPDLFPGEKWHLARKCTAQPGGPGAQKP